jgi:hypothetical protein
MYIFISTYLFIHNIYIYIHTFESNQQNTARGSIGTAPGTCIYIHANIYIYTQYL